MWQAFDQVDPTSRPLVLTTLKCTIDSSTHYALQPLWTMDIHLPMNNKHLLSSLRPSWSNILVGQQFSHSFLFFTPWTHKYVSLQVYHCFSTFCQQHCTFLGTISRGKTAILLDFVQMRGGRALPIFLDTFSQVLFWPIKGVYFLKNANNLNFKVFLGCIHDPQSKNFAFIPEEFWIRDILDVT